MTSNDLITYSRALAAALDDVHAAVYLAQVLELEVLPGAPVYLAPADVALVTGMRADHAARARNLLVQAGVLAICGKSAHRLGHTVQQHVLDELLADDAAPAVAAVEAEPVHREVHLEDVRTGIFDGVSGERLMKNRPLLECLLALWAATWGKRDGPKLTKERRSAFRRAFIEERRKPSEVARAIVGMVEDEWTGRSDHCDLPLVVRHLDKWIALANEVESGLRESKRATAGRRTKTISGVVVPEAYAWTPQDDAALSLGYRFDFATCTWIK